MINILNTVEDLEVGKRDGVTKKYIRFWEIYQVWLSDDASTLLKVMQPALYKH